MEDDLTIESMLKSTVRSWAGLSIKKLSKARKFQKLWESRKIQRESMLNDEGLVVPQVIILSPTMTCNFSCSGCYSRNYSNDGELSLERIDALCSEASDVGTFAMIITGGEPLMKQGLISVLGKHGSILFFLFTNGSLIDESIAKKLTKIDNVVPVLSVDGSMEQTDTRRGTGTYKQVMDAMINLDAAGIFFGFSTMITSENMDTVVNHDFVEHLKSCGCRIGFLMEYIPVESNPNIALVPSGEQRDQIRSFIVSTRKEKQLILFQLPEDAHDERNCGAAGRFIHVNARGDLEPCPFSHYAQTSIQKDSLRNALKSSFLEDIRNTPALFERHRLGCALVENDKVLKQIALNNGAWATEQLINIRTANKGKCKR